MSVAAFAGADVTAARDAAKGYARIELTGEDDVIDLLAGTALRVCEAFVGQLLIARTVEEVRTAAGEWRRLGEGPVRSVTSVIGLPADGASFVLPVDAYAIDIDERGDGWVRVSRPGAAGRVRVTYQAGLASGWDGVPEPLRQGVVRLIVHLVTHRDRDDEGPPPAAVAALWRPFRRMRLG